MSLLPTDAVVAVARHRHAALVVVARRATHVLARRELVALARVAVLSRRVAHVELVTLRVIARQGLARLDLRAGKGALGGFAYLL